MRQRMNSSINKLRSIFRYGGKKISHEEINNGIQSEYKEFSEGEFNLIKRIEPYTMTSPQRIIAAADAVKYISKYNIEGAIVECGVWRGGSMMAIAETLMALHSFDRELFLFDTYEGMPPPGKVDQDWRGNFASDLMSSQDKLTSNVWAVADLHDVKENMKSTGYPMDNITLVKGRVEDTIPEYAPNDIAILRLDTDWYESTYHELVNLYPRVVGGGVVIIDDYGHWNGCKKAVDEYIEKNNCRILLNRIDYTGRVFIKQL